MRIINVVKAFPAVQELTKREFPFASAYALNKLFKRMQEDASFYAANELKIVSKYAVLEDGKIKFNENGRFSFADSQAMDGYLKDIKELSDIEVSYEPLTIPAPDNISPETLNLIEGFIEFKEE